MPNLPSMSNPSFGMPSMGGGDYSGSKGGSMGVPQWPSMPTGGFQPFNPFGGQLPSAPNLSVGQGMNYNQQPYDSFGSQFGGQSGAGVMSNGFTPPSYRIAPPPTGSYRDIGGKIQQPINYGRPTPVGSFVPVSQSRNTFGGR